VGAADSWGRVDTRARLLVAMGAARDPPVELRRGCSWAGIGKWPSWLPARRMRSAAGAAVFDRGGARDRQDVAGRAHGGTCDRAWDLAAVGSLLGGGGASPFWPWAQLLGTLAAGYHDEILAARLGGGAAQIAQLVPKLAERVS
jgi:hypothetical protein